MSPPHVMLFSMKIIFLYSMKYRTHTPLSLLHPSPMITPFSNHCLPQFLPRHYPLTTLKINHPRPCAARPETNIPLPIFTIITGFSLPQLLPPRPPSGIHFIRFFLILDFLHLIIILLCLFLFLLNPHPMSKLLVMIVGLKRCKLSYMFFK